MTIVAEQLAKHFGGREVVRSLDLVVRPGEIYGLIGPNGAGKTTTMRMLIGLMRPSGGRALICGADTVTQAARAKAQLGFVSAATGLYERLTPEQLLSYYAQLYGLSAAEGRARSAALIALLALEPLLARRCGRLSTGERQRVSLARALVHDPPVLVLDEPTAGLDVLAGRAVADTIRRLRDQQRTILLSTHYMTEAELLCDRIGLLYGGSLAAEGSPSAIKERYGVGSLEQVFLRLQDEGLAAATSGGEGAPR
ncbi:MAG: ABC transporter ATP-binding protein [Proteobacteria bacterium]|nr:ABC transporter ATP-binding protein [Pseudomonadota bacterium]